MPYYEYAYDLADAARYWLAFDALIAHWQRVLDGRLVEVEYESLVRDPASALRPVLEHCGLEWDASCLEFDRNRDAVATASAVQVRQPVYASSVGRWRHYQAHLEPALTVFASAGVTSVGEVGAANSRDALP